MNVQSTVSETPTKLKGIYRSNSVDTDKSKSFSSQESLQSHKEDSKTRTSSSGSSARRLSSGSSGSPSVHPKQTALSLKRQAINKNVPLLKSITQRKLLPPPAKNLIEKGVSTEVSGLRNKPKPPSVVQSSKPRAQIVAAVTSRLYNKVKKLDVGTSTENLAATVNKELSICSNARNRLRELTHKALKAHRSKNQETQTELFPVLRVKEVATDCTDLKSELGEVQDAFTEPVPPSPLQDAEVTCTLLNQFDKAALQNSLHFTRSCGSQTNSSEDKSSVSFTKYLLAEKNPIFTEAVNINISHNYLNQSDDSLESPRNSLVSFPTPDLISNHNSLEEKKLVQPDCIHLQAPTLETAYYIPSTTVYSCIADVRTVPDYKDRLTSIEVLAALAPESILQTTNPDQCNLLPDFCPKLAKADRSRQTNYLHTPTSFKPEVHYCSTQTLSTSSGSSCKESEDERTSIPQDYFVSNEKKVQRNKKPRRQKNERLMEAMKEFLQEAKVLMSNLAETRNFERVQCHQPHLDEFDIQVTLNDISGLHNSLESGTQKSTQTTPASVANTSSQTSIWSHNVANKYEALLEDSCKRLQEKIDQTPRSRHVSLTSEDLFKDEMCSGLRYNPWDLSHVEEFSSLESQPATFSDYGSLPRKTHKRHRTPTCSPSVFLKQLTEVRRQIIENSRDEMMHESNISH